MKEQGWPFSMILQGLTRVSIDRGGGQWRWTKVVDCKVLMSSKQRRCTEEVDR